MPDVRETLIEILREQSPLTTEQLGQELGKRMPHLKNPRASISNAGLNYEQIVAADAAGRNPNYYFLPKRMTGATVRFPVPAAAKDNRVIVGAEVGVFLGPSGHRQGPAPRISLEGGPEISLRGESAHWRSAIDDILFPPTFWSWWAIKAANGFDALELTCTDGEQGKYTGRAVKSAELDAERIAARDAEVREATAKVIPKGARDGADWSRVASRLFARGLYHDPVAPSPLRKILFDPPTIFAPSRQGIELRTDLTPALRRIFAERLNAPLDDRTAGFPAVFDKLFDPFLMREPPEGFEESEEDREDETEEASDAPNAAPRTGGRRRPAVGEHGVRLKVALEGFKGIWRTVEILEDQTLHDLHRSIQEAFNWDDDHLYSFNLTGKRHDLLTDVAMPYSSWKNPDYDPPTADEIRIGEIELAPKQAFSYVFDFGDNWQCTITMVGAFEPDLEREYPIVSELHGEAPPQYPNDENWGEGDEDGWEILIISDRIPPTPDG